AAHTVLVVDDNTYERREMAQIVEQGGMRAVVADGGIKCMQIIAATMPDALVLDLIMPDMDGFAVLEMIRSDPATRNLPVIVVTSKDLTAEDREKLTGKVSSILAKSDTTSTALLEEIKKILGNIEKFHKHPESRKLKAVNRILLVEDNEAAMIQVKTVLASEGYGVDVARGGKQALEYIKDTIPNGIILDLMMPEVDGFEVLQNIRSHEATAHIPILILTAKDLTQEDFKKIKNNNIKQLIQKGDMAREDLLVKVKSMLGEKTQAAIETPVPKSKIQQPEPARERKTAGMSTILVVEDNPDNMVSIKAVLQNKYALLEATDGKEGLKEAIIKGPDLILLDMSLPGMDGFTVAGKLKEEDKTRHIPIIAVTARAMKGDRETILEAGCDDYMSKPIDPEIVLKKIEDWIRKLS
ncbi:MAG: response regulator, partial [Desulfobacula sp.]|nr:response regulator [Desulfobacula sp.]